MGGFQFSPPIRPLVEPGASLAKEPALLEPGGTDILSFPPSIFSLKIVPG